MDKTKFHTWKEGEEKSSLQKSGMSFRQSEKKNEKSLISELVLVRLNFFSLSLSDLFMLRTQSALNMLHFDPLMRQTLIQVSLISIDRDQNRRFRQNARTIQEINHISDAFSDMIRFTL